MVLKIAGLERSRNRKNGYDARIVSAYWKGEGIPQPALEFRFHPERRWEFDFAWPDQKVALEVDGGIWIYGRHNRGAQIKKSWEKENEANCCAWHIYKCEPKELCTREIANLLKRALKL